MPSQQQETSYLEAKGQLEQLLVAEPPNSPKKQQAQKVLDEIEQLKKAGTLPFEDATDLLNNTRDLLNHSKTPEDYQAIAHNVKGSSSLAMKILGGLMIVLGAIVAAACAVLAATTGIVLSGEGVTGAGIAAAGIGIFSGGMRGGLSKTMHDLGDIARENRPT